MCFETNQNIISHKHVQTACIHISNVQMWIRTIIFTRHHAWHADVQKINNRETQSRTCATEKSHDDNNLFQILVSPTRIKSSNAHMHIHSMFAFLMCTRDSSMCCLLRLPPCLVISTHFAHSPSVVQCQKIQLNNGCCLRPELGPDPPNARWVLPNHEWLQPLSPRPVPQTLP